MTNENEINIKEGLEKLINDAKNNKNVVEYNDIGLSLIHI